MFDRQSEFNALQRFKQINYLLEFLEAFLNSMCDPTSARFRVFYWDHFNQNCVSKIWQNTKNGKAIWSNYEGQRNHDVILAITAFNFNKNIPKFIFFFLNLHANVNIFRDWKIQIQIIVG